MFHQIPPQHVSLSLSLFQMPDKFSFTSKDLIPKSLKDDCAREEEDGHDHKKTKITWNNSNISLNDPKASSTAHGQALDEIIVMEQENCCPWTSEADDGLVNSAGRVTCV